jgi:hypothetical protein
VIRGFVGLALFLLVVFAVLFLGGLCSAWFEVRSERRAGLVPTRPADEVRAKRRARGDGIRGSARIWWRETRTGIPQCWCGLGTLIEYRAVGSVPGAYTSTTGLGCMAFENGDPEACERHERAGGYSRTPVAS